MSNKIITISLVALFSLAFFFLGKSTGSVSADIKTNQLQLKQNKEVIDSLTAVIAAKKASIFSDTAGLAGLRKSNDSLKTKADWFKNDRNAWKKKYNARTPVNNLPVVIVDSLWNELLRSN